MSDQFSLFSKTRSTEEAMDLLESRYAGLIKIAREEAVAICRERGEVHTQVLLQRIGHLVPEDSSKHWLGAVFRDPRFKWTGRYHYHVDDARNVHGCEVKVWCLAVTPGEAPTAVVRPTKKEIAEALEDMRILFQHVKQPSVGYIKVGKWLKSLL